jgi:hypothetical protein
MREDSIHGSCIEQEMKKIKDCHADDENTASCKTVWTEFLNATMGFEGECKYVTMNLT